MYGQLQVQGRLEGWQSGQSGSRVEGRDIKYPYSPSRAVVGRGKEEVQPQALECWHMPIGLKRRSSEDEKERDCRVQQQRGQFNSLN
jgi:hypothetical protein